MVLVVAGAAGFLLGLGFAFLVTRGGAKAPPLVTLVPEVGVGREVVYRTEREPRDRWVVAAVENGRLVITRHDRLERRVRVAEVEAVG